jgi:very-short-patch-repair endonuclease
MAVTRNTSDTECRSRYKLGPVDARIAKVAAVQHGVITTSQLRGLEIATSSITYRLADGRLHHVLPRVYATMPWHRLSRDGRMLAATLSAGPDSAISHETAAIEWGIWKPHRARDPRAIHVVTPRRHRGLGPVEVHTAAALRRSEWCVRGGIRRTTVARTLVDLGAVLTPWQLAHAWHHADFRLKPDRAEVLAIVERMGTARNVSVVRRALRLVEAGSSGTHSALEDAFLAWALAARVREPWVNRHVPMADGGTIRVDVCWPRERIVVEVDGSGHVGRVHTTAEDDSRNRRILDSGFLLVRVPPARVLAPDPRLLATLPRR